LTRGGYILIFLILPLLLEKSIYATSEEIVVAVSIEGLAPLVWEIGGDYVRIVTILPSGVEPHHYNLEPSVIEKAVESDLIFISGHIGWEESLVEAVSERTGRDVGEISLNPLTDVENLTFINIGGGRNLHGYWIYPPNAVEIGRKLMEKLSSVRPTLKEYFERRFESFRRKIDKLWSELKRAGEEAGLYGESVVIAFPAEAYVVVAAGMNVGATLIEEAGVGVKPTVIEDARRGLLEGRYAAIFISDIGLQNPVYEWVEKLGEETGKPIVVVKVFPIPGIYNFDSIFSFNIGSILSQKTGVLRTMGEGEFYLSVIAILCLVLIGISIMFIRWGRER